MNCKAAAASQTSIGGSQLVLPCLGLPFKLGMLYDCRQNTIVPGMTLWDAEMLEGAFGERQQPSSEFHVIAEDSLSKKMIGLEIGGNLGLSVMSGLVNVEGAAKYVYDRKSSSNQARVSLKYKSTTKFQQLTMEQLATANIQYPDVFEKDIATHVVTAVLYGADAFFVFDREVQANEKHHDVHGKMEALVRIIPSIVIDPKGSISLDIDKQDIQETEKFHCKFYGDLILDRNPSTYQDAVKVYNELPNYIRKQHIPKKVWLYPLCNLDSKASQIVREISINLVIHTQQLMDELNNIETRANDLSKNDFYNCFPVLREGVNRFQDIIREYNTNFMKLLSGLLTNIRKGEAEEENLVHILRHAGDNSPLSIKSFKKWLEYKEEEAKFLENIIDRFLKAKEIIAAFTPSDFGSLFCSSECSEVLRFEFKFSEISDGGRLQGMQQYKQSDLSTDCLSEPWYNQGEILSNIFSKMQTFITFAENNYQRKGIKFVVSDTSKESDNIVAQAVIMHYNLGRPVGEFELPSQPEQLKSVDVTSDSVDLEWEAPKCGSMNIEHYEISYCSLNESQDTGSILTQQSKETKATISGLKEGTKYEFRVYGETQFGYSEKSKLRIETKECLVSTHLQNICSPSKCIQNCSPIIYKIEPTTIRADVDDKSATKWTLGRTPHPPKPTKVLMLVGATGAGKSTLINAMVNYIFGVKWEHDFRLKVIHDEVSKSQAHSQTQSITAYTFNWYKGSPLNCNLTIIDTPGFGDTRGLERDQEITALIRDFFKMRGGIDELHTIGFVTQASLARLTHTQKYIFDSILAMFGKDIKDSIFIMTTFADSDEPPVMEAVKQAEIPHCCFFPFNNSALFADSSVKSKFSKLFWEMGYASMEDFFVEFEKAHSVSLQLTCEVLDERHQLETIVTGIQPQIDAGLAKMDELNQEEQILRANESDILANKDFTYEVKLIKQRQTMAPKGTYVTTCVECHYTCHDSCAYADDRDKWKCSAMNKGGQNNATCTICPGKCHWRKHFNNGFIFELYEEIETRTSQELLDRYKKAESAKANVEAVITTMEEELQEIQDGVLYNIRQARKCLQRLDEIALKPNPLTEVEYIDLLIRSEEQQKGVGWKNRIDCLNKVRQKAEILSKVKDSKEMEKALEQGSKNWWNKFTSGVRDLVARSN